MNTYINVGNYDELGYTKIQSRFDKIKEYYELIAHIDTSVFGEDVYYKGEDIVFRISGKFNSYFLSYSTKSYYESSNWPKSVNVITYEEWLNNTPQNTVAEEDDTEDKKYTPKENSHYIYLLKDNMSFALETMCGYVVDDYITLLDYSDIGEVNVYTADYLLNSVSSAFDMDKFYQIPVKNPDRATINDVFDFLKKEK